ncbi:acyl-CoA thioester hydrolase [Streptomyces sp. Amel2xB2]|uniref:thioesterase family protein n=1 Tax=Streptomyces sp. Amel2xB2 TaxID=1305829 RepID=UPI000DB9412D|nr:thioesterase family protein [Streptomyces sp. Amel2xB2]RAJ57304.1 acyl-CoA thioester hydrolase [Streptomyces sp. Amel2xB2]
MSTEQNTGQNGGQNGGTGTGAGAARISDHTETVRHEWIDYNGHMNEAFYVLIFGHASDAMMIETGMDERYREETGCSLYTAEAHVRYRREVSEGAEVTVRTRVLGVDAKKVRLALEMRTAEGTPPVATTELIMVHVDQRAGGSCPFPDAVRERFAAATESVPEWAGGAIRPVPGS